MKNYARYFALSMVAVSHGLLSCASAQATRVVIDQRIQDLCYEGPGYPENLNILLWEEGVGHPIPLNRQEVADELMGRNDSLRTLTAQEAASVGAKSGHNYLVAVCVPGNPPVHSMEDFEVWALDKNISWNVDNIHSHVMTEASGSASFSQIPTMKRSLIYYSFPSRFTLNKHSHVLAWGE